MGEQRKADKRTKASAAGPERQSPGAEATYDSVTLESPSAREGHFAGPPPDSFTGYQILREIHRGGQGVVYQAVHESTKRKVAIKVMREGPFAGSGDRARFDREIQVLGQLNHPAIVAVHDTGVAAGCHYFVMDYISGQSLDAYLQGPQRSVDDTLKLFARICDAINAAHLRGVIHRDLKPGNVRIDNEGEPHVLDFGLAKVATSDAEAAAMTMTGQFIGSLPWASPEQAEGASGKIDLRTDVYSLGVILYQMLTGKFPYEVVGSMRDVLDRIMRAEPARPSTIRKQINDEVETIVLKCLQKERDRRYQTAGELARDIRHYLAGEPIEAKRDSVGYLLRKQLRRYRVPAAIAAAFVLVVTVGFVTSLTFWRQARQEADHSRAVSDFLQQLVFAVNPEQARAMNISVPEMVAKSRELFGEDHAVVASVLCSWATSLRDAGELERAERALREGLKLYRAAYGDNHASVAATLDTLGDVLVKQRRYQEAEQIYRQAIAVQRQVFGERSEPLADALISLTDLLFKVDSGDRTEEMKQTWAEAVDIYRETLGDTDRKTVRQLAAFAQWLHANRRYDEAEPLLREAVGLARENLRGDETYVLTLNALIQLYLFQNPSDARAKPYFAEIVDVTRERWGGDNPHHASALFQYGHWLASIGETDAALATLRQWLAWRKSTSATPDMAFLAAEKRLLELLMQRPDENREDIRAAWIFSVDDARAVFGDSSPMYAEVLDQATAWLVDNRFHADAEPWCAELLAKRRQADPPDPEALAEALLWLGHVKLRLDNASAAEPFLREAMEIRAEHDGEDALETALARGWLGECLTALERYDEAERLLLSSQVTVSETRDAEAVDRQRAVERLIRLYEAWGKPEDVAEWRARLGVSD